METEKRDVMDERISQITDHLKRWKGNNGVAINLTLEIVENIGHVFKPPHEEYDKPDQLTASEAEIALKAFRQARQSLRLFSEIFGEVHEAIADRVESLNNDPHRFVRVLMLTVEKLADAVTHDLEMNIAMREADQIMAATGLDVVLNA